MSSPGPSRMSLSLSPKEKSSVSSSLKSAMRRSIDVLRFRPSLSSKSGKRGVLGSVGSFGSGSPGSNQPSPQAGPGGAPGGSASFIHSVVEEEDSDKE